MQRVQLAVQDCEEPVLHAAKARPAATPLDGAETGEAPSPEDALADSDSAWEIHKALHAMPEPYKEVFTLRVLGELSFARIAELFGKSESWARVTFFRAKTMLRRDTDG